jgi:hypothetical protein
VPDVLRAEVMLAGGRSVRLQAELSVAQFVQFLDALGAGASC